MKKKNQKSLEEQLHEFEKISAYVEPTYTDFEPLYIDRIQPIADSPYMFNYFHWITDFRAMKIMHIKGLNKMLGYDDRLFNLKKSFEIIHPKFQPFVHEFAKTAYEMLSEKKYQPLSSKAHYSIQFPMLKADGQYILVQMNVSIIMTDKSGNALMNYNRFEVLGPYFDGPILIKPRVYFSTQLDYSNRAREAEAELLIKVRNFLMSRIALSRQEEKVARLLGDGKKPAEISKTLRISPETLKKHNRKILQKGKATLSELFKDANDVAQYLKRMDIF